MRSQALALVVVVCALAYHCVDAGGEECKDQFKVMKREINKLFDDGKAPECAVELKLDQFKCTGGEDEEKDKEVRNKFKAWFDEQDEEAQGKTKECMVELAAAAMEAAGDEISKECKNEMKEFQEKMTEK